MSEVNMEQTISLDIQGMHCASCVSRIERSLRKLPGVVGGEVNLATNRAEVDFDPALVTTDLLIKAVEKSGYAATVTPISPTKAEDPAPGFDPALSNILWSAGLSLPVFVLSMFWMDRPIGLEWMLAVLTTVVVFWFGRQFFTGAWNALSHGGSATMDTLIALGSSAAYFYSLAQLIMGRQGQVYFETSATIVTLILAGRWLEARAKQRASNAIQALLSLAPESARLVGPDGKEEDILLSRVVKGNLLRVRPGERLATDGLVVDGSSKIDESMLTGESVPVDKKPGDTVIGGTMNTNGTLVYRATAIGADTVLSRMVSLVERAQGSKAPVQHLADKISGIFVPVVLVIALTTLVLWTFLLHAPLSQALTHAVAVLVIACPCALGLATPTAIMVGTGRGATLGILIKNGEVLERADKIKCVAFDKTGTLTEGQPGVSDVLTFGGMPRAKLLSYASAAERGSEHPIGRAIVKAGNEGQAPDIESRGFQALSGKGISANVEGERILVGTLSLLKEFKVNIPAILEMQAAHLEKQAKSVVYVAIGAEAAGIIAVTDRIRAGAKEAVARLKTLGLDVVMLTGDSPQVTIAVSQEIGIVEASAEVKPEEKVQEIIDRQQGGRRAVAMVGDGINDAPALAQADLGIAMGKATNVAMEAADITLLRSDLNGVADAILLSRKTMAIIRQNLFWAFIFNAIGIPLAASGRLNPMIAALAMALSSVTVVSNSLRLKKTRLGTYVQSSGDK